MSKTSPWHSVLETDVYHDNTDCTKGNNIEEENLRSGTGEKRLCEECEMLDNKEEKLKKLYW
jgi:hypothetical protein